MNDIMHIKIYVHSIWYERVRVLRERSTVITNIFQCARTLLNPFLAEARVIFCLPLINPWDYDYNISDYCGLNRYQYRKVNLISTPLSTDHRIILRFLNPINKVRLAAQNKDNFSSAERDVYMMITHSRDQGYTRGSLPNAVKLQLSTLFVP